MRARYLLDTNICIYIIRDKPIEVRSKFERIKPGEAAISVVTFGELHFGAAKSRKRQSTLALLQELTAIVPVLELPEEAGIQYGAIRASLETKGQPIGNSDLWIAAHAKSAGMILVTNNEREFTRIAGLEIENWAKN